MEDRSLEDRELAERHLFIIARDQASLWEYLRREFASETNVEVILDRRQAIRRALESARPGDVVLLAGKGHERTLILPDGPIPWNEREEAEAALRELSLASERPSS